jgi:hypothetical protein
MYVFAYSYSPTHTTFPQQKNEQPTHPSTHTNKHQKSCQRYLPVLVPLLGKTTQLDVGFSVEDAADEEEDGVLASDGAR